MTEPKKRKNLIDHIREAHENSINFSKSFDLSKSQEQHLSTPETEQMDDSTSQQLDKSESDQGQVRVKSGSSQSQVRVKSESSQGQVSGQGQVSIRSGSSIRSVSGQGQVSSIRSGSGQGQLDTNSIEISLAPQQQKIYFWFFNNGISGSFNKYQIQKETGINYPSIRKSISKLEMTGLIILFGYDPVSRRQRYVLNPKMKVLSGSGIRSGSGQGQVSSIRSGSGQGQLDTNSASYNIDRQIYININNLSIYLEYSDFWKGQGLTLKKCQQWMTEMQDLTPDFLLIQLQFGEEAETVIKADKPLSYFRSCLMTGGLERPKGFEFPAERIARIKQLEFENQQKILSEQESLLKKEEEQARKNSVIAMRQDKKTIDYLKTKIKTRYMTPTMEFSIELYESTGEIDPRLGRALEIEFLREDGK